MKHSIIRSWLVCLSLCLFSATATAIDLPPQLEFEYGTLLSRAEYVVSNETTPPEAAHWTATQLPHSWQADKHFEIDETQSVWYKVTIPPTVSSQQANGLYLERSLQNISVFLNNDWLGGSANLSVPTERNWNQPHLIAIPETSWQEGDNTLYLRLIGDANYGVVSSPLFGDYQLLKQQVYDRKQLIRIDLARASFTLLLILSTFSFLLWRKTRQNMLIFASLACFFWLVSVVYCYWRFFPLNHDHFVRLTHLSLDASIGMLVLFVRAKYELVLRPYVIAATVYLVLLAVLLFSYREGSVIPLANRLHLITILLVCITAMYVLFHFIKSPNLSDACLFIGLSVIVGLFIHDVSLSLSYSYSDNWRRWYKQSHIGYLSMSITFILICFSLSNMFRKYLAAKQQLNKELEERISIMKATLAEQHKKREQLEAEQQRESEREHIYSDLHDDLGAKLLSLIYASKADKTRDLARDALQDLRDVVSRNDTREVDVDALVSDTLIEQQNRCEKLQVPFDFNVTQTAQPHAYSAQTALMIKRLMRELVSVSVHQLNSKQLMFNLTIGHTGLELALQITDAEKPQELTSLEARAARLDGTLSFHYAPPEIVLSCWLPYKHTSLDSKLTPI